MTKTQNIEAATTATADVWTPANAELAELIATAGIDAAMAAHMALLED